MGGIAKIFTGGLSSLFGAETPKAPEVPAAPLPPANDDAARREQDALAEEERRKRAASGRASTDLTSYLGDSGEGISAKKVLLG
jgi:hypothetical protein